MECVLRGKKVKHIFVDGVEKKQCSKCGRILNLSFFYRDLSKSDGYRSTCKECDMDSYIENYSERRQNWKKKYLERKRILEEKKKNGSVEKMVDKVAKRENVKKQQLNNILESAIYVRKDVLEQNMDLFFDELREYYGKLGKSSYVRTLDAIEDRFDNMVKTLFMHNSKKEAK